MELTEITLGDLMKEIGAMVGSDIRISESIIRSINPKAAPSWEVQIRSGPGWKRIFGSNARECCVAFAAGMHCSVTLRSQYIQEQLDLEKAQLHQHQEGEVEDEFPRILP